MASPRRQAGRKGAPAADPLAALQQSAGNEATSDLLAGRDGAPIPPALRQDMERRFGQDFSAVRLHDDPRAAELAIGLSAEPFTVGNHIAFSSGQFVADTRDGRQLLAHELAHVVQRRRGDATTPPVAGSTTSYAAGLAAQRNLRLGSGHTILSAGLYGGVRHEDDTVGKPSYPSTSGYGGAYIGGSFY